MSLKKCVVTLTAEERSLLQSLVSKDKVGARKRLRAQILLKADEGAARPELERRAYRPRPSMWMCARLSGCAGVADSPPLKALKSP